MYFWNETNICNLRGKSILKNELGFSIFYMWNLRIMLGKALWKFIQFFAINTENSTSILESNNNYSYIKLVVVFIIFDQEKNNPVSMRIVFFWLFRVDFTYFCKMEDFLKMKSSIKNLENPTSTWKLWKPWRMYRYWFLQLKARGLEDVWDYGFFRGRCHFFWKHCIALKAPFRVGFDAVLKRKKKHQKVLEQFWRNSEKNKMFKLHYNKTKQKNLTNLNQALLHILWLGVSFMWW